MRPERGVFILPATRDSRIVISEYNGSSAGSYIGPSPGEVIYTTAVREAREKYAGEKRYKTTVVGYFTESDLSHFKTNPEYGYIFYFVTNGDGSGITVDENDIITSFPASHT